MNLKLAFAFAAVVLSSQTTSAQETSGEASPEAPGAFAGGAVVGAITQGADLLKQAPTQLQNILAAARAGHEFDTEERCLAYLQLAAQFAALARNTMPFSDAWTFEDYRGPVVKLRAMLGGERFHVELNCGDKLLRAKELPWGEGPSELRPLQLSSIDAGIGALFILSGDGVFEKEPEEDVASSPPSDSALPPGQGSDAVGSAGQSGAPDAPAEPRLTDGEKDAFKLAAQRCWNMPAGLRDASKLRVTVGAELKADGSIVSSSLTLIEPGPSPDAATKSLFDATRRALIRCSPFMDLPQEKYAQWRYITLRANSEGIVSW
jgi:hypothetical protein